MWIALRMYQVLYLSSHLWQILVFPMSLLSFLDDINNRINILNQDHTCPFAGYYCKTTLALKVWEYDWLLNKGAWGEHCVQLPGLAPKGKASPTASPPPGSHWLECGTSYLRPQVEAECWNCEATWWGGSPDSVDQKAWIVYQNFCITEAQTFPCSSDYYFGCVISTKPTS